jgi:hypothetical protein
MVRDNPLRISAIRYPLADIRQCQRIPASGCGCPLSPEILADIRVSQRISAHIGGKKIKNKEKTQEQIK